MKVVFIELTNKAGKVGMLEETGENDLCKLGHVLDDEAVTLDTPADNVCKHGILEHPNKLAHEIRSSWHAVFRITSEKSVVIGGIERLLMRVSRPEFWVVSAHLRREVVQVVETGEVMRCAESVAVHYILRGLVLRVPSSATGCGLDLALGLRGEWALEISKENRTCTMDYCLTRRRVRLPPERASFPLSV